ncbi:MAG: hypothetical protein J6C98_05730 [Oscillospiraceae bacterium]|nr:hypothetical protein [Oscillospiraceae bacterium]
MRRFKLWLIEQFLPVWLKSELLRENDRLRAELREKDTHIRELNAYIEGLEFGLRTQRRITINNRLGRYANDNKSPEEVKA